MLERTRRWLSAHPDWLLALATMAMFAPFLAKPFNMDDPLFIWAAHQIRLHPANPYGFNLIWGQSPFPMWNVTDNPPLACYYLAAASLVFGWSAVGLHLAFLGPALAVVWGTRRLASHFCACPTLAALATLCTPVFLVSGLTVMCDVVMLALWIWAAVSWVEGLQRDDAGRLAWSGLLMALAFLSKYYGACLVPLLGAYGLLRKRRPGLWMLYLLIPLAVIYAYQVATLLLYGHNLLRRALQFSTFVKANYGYTGTAEMLKTLAFTGGCMAVAVFFTPFLWRRKRMAVGAFILVAGILLLIRGPIEKSPGASQWVSPAWVMVQIAFWGAGGICVLALAIADVIQRREAASWLLALWVAGTFAFVAFFNWTVNGRSILPMAPAVGILMARRLERNVPDGRGVWTPGTVGALAAGAALALAVMRADLLLARAVREAAQTCCTQFQAPGRTLWFQGHWGFQYYMQNLGAKPIDLDHPGLKAGDIFFVPGNNANLRSPELDLSHPRAIIVVPKSRFLATMDDATGAGFYASLTAALPFAFGRVPPEQVAEFDYHGPPP